MIENDSTRKLEANGRTRGLQITVRKIEGRKDGLFFVTKSGTKPRPIGFSIREAEAWIEKHRVVKTTLNPVEVWMLQQHIGHGMERVETLRNNGYTRVADALEDHIKRSKHARHAQVSADTGTGKHEG